MRTFSSLLFSSLLLVCTLSAVNAQADPLGTAFTYQGQLTFNGSPASGNFDFQFALFTVASSGTAMETLTLTHQSVSAGLINASLAYTDVPFEFNGQALWIEVRVRPAGSGTYTVLTPRQPVNATPYALFALTGNQGPSGPTGPQGPAGVVTLPFSGATSTTAPALQIQNSGPAINAIGTGTGLANPALNAQGTGIGAIITNTSTDTALLLGNNIAGGTGNLVKAFVPAGVFVIDGKGNMVTPTTVTASNVTGTGTTGDGLNGKSASTSGGVAIRGAGTGQTWGVVGSSGNGNGVYGTSAGAGVWGESTGYDAVHGHTSNPANNASGVAGFGDGGNTGTFGISTSGNGVGGLSTSGNGVYGHSNSGYGMATDGPAQQSRNQGGFVKAMAVVRPVAQGGTVEHTILRCFNSQLPASQASTPPCGFTEREPAIGSVVIDFGFEVDDRFVIANGVFAAVNISTATIDQGDGFLNSNTEVQIDTYIPGASFTIDEQFAIIVF